jgi:peptide chain release factor subunit 1
LIVVGRKRASIGYTKGKQIEILKDFSSGVPSKHTAGGQSQRRFERIIQEQEINFYRRLVKFMNQEFLQLKNLKAIFVGGAGNSKKKFVKERNIDYRLKPLIQNTIDLPYDGGYEGFRALVNQLSNRITVLQYSREKQTVQKFLKELAEDSGLAIYGYTATKKALNANRVNMLIISEDFKHSNEYLPTAFKNQVSVEMISKDTEYGEMIKSFGGIVALARYSC